MRQLKDSNKYNRIHKRRLARNIKTGTCVHCLENKKTEWSNISGEYNEDDSDWQELCKLCHRKFDIEVHQIKNGRPKLTAEEKLFNAEYRKALPRLRTYTWFVED